MVLTLILVVRKAVMCSLRDGSAGLVAEQDS
jgi:hypothetical protein